MTKANISDFDIFYISYDEPNKEENWAKLQQLAPWAQRIDGVKGFDSAHKAAANASSTDKFITVDGDNIVYPEFFDLSLDIPEKLDNCSLSWAGRNIINGLCYGNGGLKLWTKEFVLNMRTHENAATEAEKLDFCWDNKYVQLNNIYSDTCPNGSPFQAFRAGFREGVKMTLERGDKVGEGKISKHLHPLNFNRLLIWASIGADVENGLWAIYGTRMGIYRTNIEKGFDIAQISDYDWFKSYFANEVITLVRGRETEKCKYTGETWDMNALKHSSSILLDPLQKSLGLEIADMNAEQSKFFKAVYMPPKRTNNPLITEMEAA